MKSRILPILILCLGCQILLAVNPMLEDLKHLDSKKKLKFVLQDGTTFKGYIIKSEDNRIYSVSTRKEKRLAINNNCDHCLITNVSDIKTIKVKKLAPIFAVTFMLVGFALALAIAAFTTAENSNGPLLSTTLMILLPLFLLVGFGLGSFLDEFI